MASLPYRSIITACEALVNDLSRGLRASRKSALTKQELDSLAHAGLLAVLRMTTMLLFEARGLVPESKKTWRQRVSLFSDAQISWKKVRSGWTILDEGHRQLGLEPYPGELFRPAIAPLLHEPELEVEDDTLEKLRKAITPLAQDGGDVRWLGELYEALLSRAPSVARRGAPIRLKPDASRRRRRGSFFTPAFIVETIIEATFGRPLASARTPDGLLALKLADPSCGTGHFLVSALHRIASHMAELRREPPGPESLGEVARSCLYGVDVDPVAVELARASLMLEVGGSRWTDFTGTIRCGNALLGVGRAELSAEPSGADTRAGLFSKKGSLPPPPGLAAERLADAHLGAAFGLEVPSDEYLEALELARSGSLKPDAYPWLGEAARLARRKQFFHWELAFPEVFTEGGFDAVVSNPPYVVASALPDDERDFLRRRFIAPGDLYVMTLELGFKLLKRGGRLGLICPRFLCFNRSLAPLREWLLAEGGLVALIDAGRPFPGVQTECVVFVLQASRPTGQERCRLIAWNDLGQTVRATLVPQDTFGRLPHSAFNLALSPEWLDLAEKLNGRGVPLSQVCLTRRGMELGRGALLDDRRAVPVLVGAEVVPFAPPKPAGRVDRFRPEFGSYMGLVRRPWRVLVRRVAPRLAATVDDTGYHFLKNLYAVVPRPGCRIGPYYLAACLNSRLMNSYFKVWWTTKKVRIFPEVQKYQLDGLPIIWLPEAPDEPEEVESLERFAAWLRKPASSLELDEALAILDADDKEPAPDMLAAAIAVVGRRISVLEGERAGEAEEVVHGLQTRSLLTPEEVHQALSGRTRPITEKEWAKLLEHGAHKLDEAARRELEEDFAAYRSSVASMQQDMSRFHGLLDGLVYRLYGLTEEEIALVESHEEP